jgi:hypothetical protein
MAAAAALSAVVLLFIATLATLMSVANAVECPMIKCPEMYCEFGFEYDANGCQLCQCHPDPRIATTCPVGYQCQVVTVFCIRAPCYPVAECIPNPKPGSCPAPSDYGICIQDCDSDADCDGDQKCCSNGCGKVCLSPEHNKPGDCPMPSGDGNCVDECNVDNECSNSQKCCSTGCGRSCQQPAPVGHTAICPKRPCYFRCRYGLQYGPHCCQLCSCYDDPCQQERSCPPGTQCQAVLREPTPRCGPPFKAACVPIVPA